NNPHIDLLEISIKIKQTILAYIFFWPYEITVQSEILLNSVIGFQIFFIFFGICPDRNFGIKAIFITIKAAPKLKITDDTLVKLESADIHFSLYRRLAG